MKTALLRAALLAALVLAVASPVAAQDGCYVCRQFTDEDGYTMQYCGHPNNNEWGYESCGLGYGRLFVTCRNWGFMCYYFEVY